HTYGSRRTVLDQQGGDFYAMIFHHTFTDVFDQSLGLRFLLYQFSLIMVVFMIMAFCGMLMVMLVVVVPVIMCMLIFCCMLMIVIFMVCVIMIVSAVRMVMSLTMFMVRAM